MTEEAIKLIESEFPNQNKPEDFIEAHRGSEDREAFAEFFQLLVDTDNVNQLNDSDAKFSVTFRLSLWERVKALFTGGYKADIGPLLSESVGFGVCWQHQDILQTLEDNRNKAGESGD